MKQELIIFTAIEALEAQTGVEAAYVQTNRDEIDGMLKINYDGREYIFNIEAKKEIRLYQIPAIENLNRIYHPIIVVADHIFPKVKEELRNRRIAYLEANGNTFIREKNMLLMVEKGKTAPVVRNTNGRAFAKTGLKLVFQLLDRNELINLTYRQLAQETGISFGNINFILQDLKEQGFLIRLDKDRFALNRKKELLLKWMEAYQTRLQPALLIGHFRFFNDTDEKNWKKIRLKNKETLWGGEAAGSMLTNHLFPEIYTLYTTEKKADLIKGYRLLPDEKGPVRIYQKFWPKDETNFDLVPPLLVYADLINTNDRRCTETAEKIYHDLLQDKF